MPFIIEFVFRAEQPVETTSALNKQGRIDITSGLLHDLDLKLITSRTRRVAHMEHHVGDAAGEEIPA